MAQVFLAVKTGPMGFEKQLAIKRIRTDVTLHNRARVQALINEARLGGLLKHPNVVDTYEFGVADEQHYIAMEYIEGLTLRDLLDGALARGVRVPVSAVLDIMCQVCDGLSYAHRMCSPDGVSLGLVHRDLKPSNIIVSMNGQAKIMDFGIARSSAAMFQTTTIAAPKGTLSYMSPEQLTAPRAVDGRSDIFALGAILFEAVTGEPLLSGEDMTQQVFELTTGRYVRRLEMLDANAPQLRPIVHRCSAPKPGDRYPDVDELRKDLLQQLVELEPALSCRELMRMVANLRQGGSPDVGPEVAPGVRPTWHEGRDSPFFDALLGRAPPRRDPLLGGPRPVPVPVNRSAQTRVPTSEVEDGRTDEEAEDTDQAVLIVDDEPLNVRVLGAVIRELARIIVTTDPSKVVDLALARQPDLIMLDVTMPQLSGYDVCRKLKSNPQTRDIPVIFITGNTETDDEAQGFAVGAVDYITKPFHPVIVEARVRTHLRLRRQTRRIRREAVERARFNRFASQDLLQRLDMLQSVTLMLHEHVPVGEPVSAGALRLLSRLQEQTGQTRAVVGDFLALQGLADGTTRLDLEEVEAGPLIERVAATCAPRADQRGVGLRLSLSPDVPRLRADATRLSRVVEILIDNAVFCSPPGSVVGLRLRREDALACIEVEDVGPGLTDTELHQIDSTTTVFTESDPKPMALDQALCKQVIELHGGVLGARNNPERGATYWCLVPIGRPTAPSPGRAPAP